MEISLVKQPDNTFKLAYDSDYEKSAKIKPGDIYKCTITKPRNYEHHKMYFALLNMVFDNQERYQHINDMRNDITIESGFYDEHINLHGDVVKTAKSINFASMDQFAFQELYERTKDVICLYFNFTPESIKQNIHQYY